MFANKIILDFALTAGVTRKTRIRTAMVEFRQLACLNSNQF